MKRFRQWIRCWVFDLHVDGYPVPKIGGKSVQHCEACDKPIREHPVGLAVAKRDRYAKGMRWYRR